MEAGGDEKRVARLACAGGDQRRAHSAPIMRGSNRCRAAALVSGGGKGCSWGCLGLADCERVCTFDAIQMNEYGLAGGDRSALHGLRRLRRRLPEGACSRCIAVSHRLWVACRNLLNGEIAEADCEVACTACGRCAADAPRGLIQDRQQPGGRRLCTEQAGHCRRPSQRCPTGRDRVDGRETGPVKGLDAKKITRKLRLPVELADLPLQPVGARIVGRSESGLRELD